MSKVHVKTGDTVVLLTGKDIYQYKDVTDKSKGRLEGKVVACLLYTSDAADE